MFILTLEGKCVVLLYQGNLELFEKLSPKNSKPNTPLSIISLCYSEKDKRIAILLNDNSVSMWDFNNF